jgi:hypothetical protein
MVKIVSIVYSKVSDYAKVILISLEETFNPFRLPG